MMRKLILTEHGTEGMENRMSDDLISREEVLKLLYEIKDNNSIPKNYGTILDIIREVRMIPIAFNKKK